MHRRTFLQRLGPALGFGLLAGCTGQPDPGRVGEHTTQPGGSSFPDGPKDPPERPAKLTEESVGVYAREYERRYVYNKIWMGENSTVGVACEIDGVEPIDGGYRADVSCFGTANAGGESNSDGTGTTTVAIADYFETPATYLVDEDTTIRLQSSG